MTREQKLWMNVILHAQEEAAGMHGYQGRKKPGVVKAEAIKFLTEDTQDFRVVCSNAGYKAQQCTEMLEKGREKWLRN